MESQLRRFCPRCYVMSSAEGRKVVVQGHSIAQIDDGETQAPLKTVSVEQVVVTHGKVKQVPRGDALRVVIIILLPGPWYGDKRRPQTCCGAGGQRWPRGTGSSRQAIASQPSLKFLIGRQRQGGEIVHQGHLARGKGCGGLGYNPPSAIRRRRGSKARGCRRKTRNGPRYRPAVIAPVEAQPRSVFPGLVLQVSRLVVALVVVDAENIGSRQKGY